MSVLHRYALAELARVFLLTVTAFTAILLMAGVVREAFQSGLSPVQVIGLVPLVIPGTLPYTIPAAVLLAVTVVYGRLAADNEIMAAKAAGINVLYLLFPAIGLGLLLSVLTLLLCNYLIPIANYRLRATFVDNMEDVIYSVLKREKVLRGRNFPYEIYLQDVQGKTLINTTFKRRDKDGNYSQVVYAERASLEFDLEEKLVYLRMYNAQGSGRETYVTANADHVLTIPLPELQRARKRPRDLTIRDIKNRRAELLRGLEDSVIRCVFRTSLAVGKGHFRGLPWGLLDDTDRQQFWVLRTLWRLDCEGPLRSAISFGCLSFVLLGCPVAILFQRGDYLSAFIACFLPIIALYYPLIMLGLNLSKAGHFPPIILWTGNVFLALLSAYPFRLVLRH